MSLPISQVKSQNTRGRSRENPRYTFPLSRSSDVFQKPLSISTHPYFHPSSHSPNCRCRSYASLSPSPPQTRYPFGDLYLFAGLLFPPLPFSYEVPVSDLNLLHNKLPVWGIILLVVFSIR
ncbi:hypothetical protein HBI95_035960 [Parastagonospora nodorum]|nr:hypothetical protein HBI95_035960 [Parastagonospora nodorum]